MHLLCQLPGTCALGWSVLLIDHRHFTMAQPAAVQPAGPRGNQQQQQPGNQLFATIARFAIMWWLMSYMRGNQQQQQTPAGAAAPLYRKGDPLDMYVYISEQPYLHDRSEAELIWTQQEVGLATTTERKSTYTYSPSRVSYYHFPMLSAQPACACSDHHALPPARL